MSADPLLFFRSLRSKAFFDQLLAEFYSKAEEVEIASGSSSYWVQAIIDSHHDYFYMQLNEFLFLRTSGEAQKLMAYIEKEIGELPLDPNHSALLKNYIQEIENLSLRLQKDFHLKGYRIFGEHLDQVIQNLKAFYMNPNGNGSQVSDSAEGRRVPQDQLRWTGGVASLATVFFELQTECYDDHPQPFLKATKNQIVRFIVNHFVNENGEPFSESTSATYLDPSRPEKKAKRKKAPLDEIFTKKK